MHKERSECAGAFFLDFLFNDFLLFMQRAEKKGLNGTGLNPQAETNSEKDRVFVESVSYGASLVLKKNTIHELKKNQT